MFQHILLPTDGSASSLAAARACVSFAAQVGARLTVVHVVAPVHLFTYEPLITDEVLETYGRKRDARARAFLEPVVQLAHDAKVAVSAMLAEADEPYEGLLNAAREHGCDLVMMASHGRKGVRGLLLGSQTQKLLTHSAIPVLVYRGGA